MKQTVSKHLKGQKFFEACSKIEAKGKNGVENYRLLTRPTYQEIPQGWVIDKTAGSPAPNTVFITNGKRKALLSVAD